MAEVATRKAWKTLPCPVERSYFDLPLFFTDDEAERLLAGHVPQEMDDKWFVFVEEGWLYFHCIGTGACIFGLQLSGSSAGGARVTKCWASRDHGQYTSSGVEDDMDLIGTLITSLLRGCQPS